jgi:ABC-type phosphate/phosphonate transport system substrate-binding protein
MVHSFVVGKSEAIVNIARDDFQNVLKITTGFDGDLTTKLNAFEIADKLDKKQIDFGIFHAHEFAWVRTKHADLAPLIVAVNKKHAQQVHLIVHKNSPIKSFADLRGKKLDLPTGTGELVRAYVGKLCKESDQKNPAEFFSAIEKSSGQVAALDNVAREKADATAITSVWLEFYKENKGPAYNSFLRVLSESEEFPPSVIVHKKGALDQKTIDQFTNGLLKANTTEVGRDMMKDWTIDTFEPPPQDYAKRLAEILKSYPAPK